MQCEPDEPSWTWTQIWVQSRVSDYNLNWTARFTAIQEWQRCQWCSSSNRREGDQAAAVGLSASSQPRNFDRRARMPDSPLKSLSTKQWLIELRNPHGVLCWIKCNRLTCACAPTMIASLHVEGGCSGSRNSVLLHKVLLHWKCYFELRPICATPTGVEFSTLWVAVYISFPILEVPVV